MFDFGFWELVLVLVVALLVVGPERLPKLASRVGAWTGRARRLAQQFRRNVEQEVQAEEIKELLHQQQNQIQELRDLVGEADPAGDPVADSIRERLARKPAAPAATDERRARD